LLQRYPMDVVILPELGRKGEAVDGL
jgi:hypothetical protein